MRGVSADQQPTAGRQWITPVIYGVLGLELADRRFGYPLEMVMNAAAAGWRVSEVEVTYLPRIGKSKVTGTVRGCVRTVQDMSGVLAR